MGDTKISWADKTWNPISGCSKISEGCQHCYAERMSKRLAGRCGYDKINPFQVTLHPGKMHEPMHWRKPSRIFVCSMGDLFHDYVEEMDILTMFAVMAETPHHTYMVLTKRPKRMKEILTSRTIANDVWLMTATGINDERPIWPLPNVWLGVTAENQARADERIPILLQTPAAKRFVSVEPMLGAVDLTQWIREVPVHPGLCFHGGRYGSTPKLDWVICGGETGPGARPLHPDWVRSLRDQCKVADTPFFFKSWGEYCFPSQLLNNGSKSYTDEEDPSKWSQWKVGKKNAGRLLDGQEWNQFPEVPS